MTHLEATVNECFVQVKNQAFLATELRRYRRQKPLLGWFRCGHSARLMASLLSCHARASSQNSSPGTCSGNDTGVSVLVVYLPFGQRRRWRQVDATRGRAGRALTRRGLYVGALRYIRCRQGKGRSNVSHLDICVPLGLFGCPVLDDGVLCCSFLVLRNDRCRCNYADLWVGVVCLTVMRNVPLSCVDVWRSGSRCFRLQVVFLCLQRCRFWVWLN